MNSGIFSLFFLCFHIPLCQKTWLWEGVGSGTLYNWGKSWWIISCYRGTDFRYLSWIFPPFWLFILRAWWLDTLRRQATEERIPGLPRRPWCLPGWRLPWRGDVSASAVSGNWLEGVRGFLVHEILKEAISCPGNKEEPGMEEGAPS